MLQLENIDEIFLEFSRSVPLEWYTFLGSIIEEIIGIIPSPLVLTVAGSLALSNDRSFMYLFLLGIVASVGKTLAGWLLYVIADKAEDVVVGKFGRLLGVSHESIEALGKKFGKGKRDDIVVFLTRALPIFPSAAISVASGAIRINIKTYLIATFLGNYVRCMLYLYLGYSGIEQAQVILGGIDSIGSLVKVITVLGLGIGFFVWIYYQRKKISS